MRHPIRKAFTLRYSLETLCVLLTLMGLAAVLHQFVIGKHFIIPTVILVLPLITGNVAASATATARGRSTSRSGSASSPRRTGSSRSSTRRR